MESAPNKEVEDPAGHIKIAVSDYERSSTFYLALFENLGFDQIVNTTTGAAWVTDEGFGIWIT